MAGAAVAGVRPAQAAVLPVAAGRRRRACSTTRRCASAARPAWSRASEANGLPRRHRRAVRRRCITRRSTSTSAPRRSSSCMHDGGERSFVKAQCMHCVDPACASACMLGALKKREFGIVTYDVGLLRRLPLLRGGVPLRRAEVRVELRRRRRSSSASCARTGWPKGKEPACTEVCPRHAVIFGKRDGSAATKRSGASHEHARPLRAEGLRRDRRRRHAGALPLARAVREARVPGARRRAGADAARDRSSTASTRASSRRSRSTRCSAR